MAIMGEKRNAHRILLGNSDGNKQFRRSTRAVARIRLKWILTKYDARLRAGFLGTRTRGRFL